MDIVQLDRINDVHEPLTTEQAAELAGVEPRLIRLWAYRGHLKRCNPDTERRPLYTAVAVAVAERKTRLAPQSRRSA